MGTPFSRPVPVNDNASSGKAETVTTHISEKEFEELCMPND
jgi:hypothetical protein